ncbi:GNAT family N-acetyltransferase [Eubacterium sp. 1001713B170207_170306_E7]|uniref:GNAT family N-acetyltransferase n=1 Tax=Eubacterium sp. 1001713B170207_170306_E7 TaxID=2787097 RepID=UPI00189B48EB|nr:GNAT family N-acetyltransferase [Eubacterium sp. 1001713B170207_170306_E7]
MHYRKATIDDIDLLCEIRKTQLVHEGLEPIFSIDDELRAFFRESFKNKTMMEILAVEDEKIAATGAVIFYAYPPSYSNKTGMSAYITNMFTEPAYRGQGIATKILDMLVKEVKNSGVTIIRLRASKFGMPVYKKYGFVEESDWLRLK